MSHPPLRDVLSFEIVGPYTLRIEFDNHTTQVIDFKPVLAGEVFEPLHDLEIFNQVRLDPESNNLVWPNDADFDPAELAIWPEVVDDYVKKAESIREKQASLT